MVSWTYVDKKEIKIPLQEISALLMTNGLHFGTRQLYELQLWAFGLKYLMFLASHELAMAGLRAFEDCNATDVIAMVFTE